jgi:putative addiction module component (TIGR02574 family)
LIWNLGVVRGYIERYKTRIEEVAMDSTMEVLQAAALSLPDAERARLAARLLASLDQDPEIEEEWVAEVRSRLDAFRRGEITAEPADIVMARAREILKR